MQLSASAASAKLLPTRLPEAASKYPLQPLATRKALHPLRPRSEPRSFPPHSEEAVKADTVFLAVRYESQGDVAKALPSWKGKTIIDVTNAYGVSPEELGGQPSSTAVAQAFTGAKLVKGFNHLVAGVLRQDPAVNGGRRVVFLASDDDAAAAEMGELRKISVSLRSSLAGFRKVDCSSRRVEIPGVN